MLDATFGLFPSFLNALRTAYENDYPPALGSPALPQELSNPSTRLDHLSPVVSVSPQLCLGAFDLCNSN